MEFINQATQRNLCAIILVLVLRYSEEARLTTIQQLGNVPCAVTSDSQLREPCLSLSENPTVSESPPRHRSSNRASRRLSVRRHPHSRSLHATEFAASQCPTGAARANISDGRTTPWKFKEDKDVNRYPEVILRAHCLCRGCISPITHTQFPLRYAISVPVITNLKIVKRASANISFTNCQKPDCVEDYIEVPVGCTCKRP